MPNVSGELVEIVVGYRERDPMREYADFLGGRCIDCGSFTYYNMSAHDLFTGDDHDVACVCRTCYTINRVYIDEAM